MSPQPIKEFSVSYKNAVQAILAGRDDDALRELESVEDWQQSPTIGRSARNVPYQLQMAVFRRDKFLCRYCCRRTVIPPVLRLLAVAFDQVFPYHPHGLMTACHLGFWRDIASCDHLVPVARLGSSTADNLVTACYMCNSIKQNWLIEELRWELRPIEPNADWDGLSASLHELLRIYEDRHEGARIPYFRDWLKAVQTSA
jgi:HNH endonuclease